MAEKDVRDAHRDHFGGGDPRVYRAPGRVNLIGEHTDYNDGFVLPAAIDLETLVAGAPRPDRTLAVHSETFASTAEIDLDAPTPPARDWSDYPTGVALALERRGARLRGANLLVRGGVPVGSGLSSSAALEVATGLALLDLSGIALDRTALALACQEAEHDRVGARCGIMDQFASCHGRRGHALLLDCRSLEARAIPLPEGVKIVACDTGVRHAHAGGEYNRRRAECEEGVAALARRNPRVRALRDATIDEIESPRLVVSDVVRRRCRHVVSEIARTLDAATALERGDLDALAGLMAASHASLARDYEVSCPELDALVALASEGPGVLGARMTGGGFGGSTVNLVRAGAVEAFLGHVGRKYGRAFGRAPSCVACAAAARASRIA